MPLYSAKQFNRLFEADQTFAEFARRCYAYFDGMGAGRRLTLSAYSPQQREWIMLTLAAYTSEGGGHGEDFEVEPDAWIYRHTRSNANAEKTTIRKDKKAVLEPYEVLHYRTDGARLNTPKRKNNETTTE